jgi:hypothetical protein
MFIHTIDLHLFRTRCHSFVRRDLGFTSCFHYKTCAQKTTGAEGIIFPHQTRYRGERPPFSPPQCAFTRPTPYTHTPEHATLFSFPIQYTAYLVIRVGYIPTDSQVFNTTKRCSHERIVLPLLRYHLDLSISLVSPLCSLGWFYPRTLVSLCATSRTQTGQLKAVELFFCCFLARNL